MSELRERFRQTAIALLQSAGVPATAESVRENRDHRAKFRAIVLEGKRRQKIDSPEYNALQVLVDECDAHDIAQVSAAYDEAIRSLHAVPSVTAVPDPMHKPPFNDAIEEVKRGEH